MKTWTWGVTGTGNSEAKTTVYAYCVEDNAVSIRLEVSAPGAKTVIGDDGISRAALYDAIDSIAAAVEREVGPRA
jgi:hypothetical protein